MSSFPCQVVLGQHGNQVIAITIRTPATELKSTRKKGSQEFYHFSSLKYFSSGTNLTVGGGSGLITPFAAFALSLLCSAGDILYVRCSASQHLRIRTHQFGAVCRNAVFLINHPDPRLLSIWFPQELPPPIMTFTTLSTGTLEALNSMTPPLLHLYQLGVLGPSRWIRYSFRYKG